MVVKADAHFVDCDIQGTSGLDEWSSYSTDSDPPISVIISYYPVSSSTVATKYSSDYTLDTSWATNGNWTTTAYSEWNYHCIGQYNDGGYVIGQVVGTGVTYNLSKIDSDGVLDTSWGTDGHFTTTAASPISVAIDSDDNTYIGFKTGIVQFLVKLNSSGVQQWSHALNESCYGIIHYDFNGTPIVICSMGSHNVLGVDYNVVALNASTGSVETSWGTGGYANPSVTALNRPDAYAIKEDSSGKIIIHHWNMTVNGIDYCLTRLNSDGSLDTAWGVGGHSGVNQVPVFNTKYSYNNTIEFIGGTLYSLNNLYNITAQRATVYFNSYDSVGAETRLKTITGLGNEPIKCFTGGGGKIYLAGNNVDIEGDGISTVHYYDEDMTYIGKLDSHISVTQIIKVPDTNSPDGSAYYSNYQNRTTAMPEDHSHIDGQTVQGLGDGSYLGTEEVVSGNVDMDDGTTVNHVGLPYTSTILPMKINGEVRVKKVSKVVPNFNNTVGGNYGRESDDMYSMVLKDTNDPLDADSALFSGTVELPFDGAYDRSGDIYVTQALPLPMKLLGLGVYLSEEAISGGGRVPYNGINRNPSIPLTDDKRALEIILNMNNTIKGDYGFDEDNLHDIDDSNEDLFTGTKDLPMDGGYDKTVDVYIEQNDPLPMRVLGMGVKIGG